MFGGVAAQRDLIELATLFLDAQNADVADVVMAAGIDAAGNLDLEIADFGLAGWFGKLARDLLRDRDRTGIGQGAEIEARAADHIGDQPGIAVGKAGGD